MKMYDMDAKKMKINDKRLTFSLEKIKVHNFDQKP